MTTTQLILLLVLVLVAAVTGELMWGDAPMELADDQIVWGD